MKKFNKLAWLIALLLVLPSCASSGVRVDQSQLSRFRDGETTYDQAVAALGRPSQVLMPGDGTRTIVYAYFSAQARPESFIPVVGAFVGGSDVENSVVTMRFDRDGVLRNVTSSQGSTGTGRGLEGVPQARNSAQPGQAR